MPELVDVMVGVKEITLDLEMAVEAESCAWILCNSRRVRI